MGDLKISLAAARVNAKLTQDDISQRLKVSKNTVVNWESGKTEPTISQARALSKILNFPLDLIIFMPSETN